MKNNTTPPPSSVLATTGSAFVRCGNCGTEHSHFGWAGLLLVGRQYELGLALRSCNGCRSTLSVTLADDALADLEAFRARLSLATTFSNGDYREFASLSVRLEAGVKDLVSRLRQAEDEASAANAELRENEKGEG